MNTMNASSLRIATAILAASFAFLAAPLLASPEIDSTPNTEELDDLERVSHPYLGPIDVAQATYIEAMETKLGLWE